MIFSKISFRPSLRFGKIDNIKRALCKATVLDFSIKRPSVLTRTDTRRRRCCSSRYSCVYKLYTGENNLPIMLMYSNEIQILFNIQRALFYFQNDKLLSLLAAVIARYASYMLCSTFYYSFSFVPWLSCAFQCVLQTSFFSRRLYRAIHGKFLRLKTRYNSTSRGAFRIAVYKINQAVYIVFCPSSIRASYTTRFIYTAFLSI